MADIRDVAKHAGVSIGTVSAALNDSAAVRHDTRQKVLAAVEAVGYAPNAIAQSLRRGQSRLIGIVVADISNPFCSAIMRAIEKRALADGYSAIVCNTDDDADRELRALDQLRAQRVAGIILTPVGNGAAYVRHLEARGMPPLVTLDQRVPGLRHDFAGVDNYAAARMLTEYLIGLGHERIAMICGRPGMWTADQRLAAFRDAMTEAGLSVDPSCCPAGDYDGKIAYDATVPLMARADRPTAIIGANNLMALAALQAVMDLGFTCPRDVSIAGIDDVPWSGLVRPRITSAVQPIEEIGRQAINWLLERMAAGNLGGEIAPRTSVFAPKLVIGDSCTAPSVARPAAPLPHPARLA